MYRFRNSCRPHRPGSGIATCRGWVFSLLVGAVGAGVALPLTAQELIDAPAPSVPGDDGDDPGHFEILAARSELRGGVYFLDASIDFRLSSEARAGLLSGVPLTIRLDVEVVNLRRWWLDDAAASLRQRYEVVFDALSERFVVRNLNSGEQASYATLSAALNTLGRVADLPLIDEPLLDPSETYHVRLRAVIDVEQFPGPLRLLAFWRRDWSLASDWYRWRLRGD